MKSRVLFGLMLLLFVPAICFSQDRKTIKKKQIKSQTVYEYFIEEGIKDPVIESVERYDTTGNVIELKEFNKEGVVKNWQTFKYDVDRNKIEETILDPKGKVMDRTVWIYKEGLIKEKQYFDGRDRMYKRKEYKYETMGN